MMNRRSSEPRQIEIVREALLHLYDPPALAATALAGKLLDRGAISSPKGLGELLIRMIEQLRPLDSAPARSHGWRCYRYLYLRYVDCQAHASVAAELGISPRHASRIHQEAIESLARVIFPDTGQTSGASVTHGSAALAGQRRARAQITPFREAELAMIGHQPPEGAVDLAEVTEGVGQTFQRFAAAHRVALRCDLPTTLPAVRMNRIALRQIELNMLLYLVSVTRERFGNTDIMIQLSAARSGEVIQLLARAEVDGRQQSLSSAPGESGSLLETAQYLASLQKGSLEMLDDSGSGRALLLRAPIRTERTILLVDDNADVGDLFRRMLAKSDYRIVHVRTAGRALSVVRETPVDAIILDVVMPSRDGWEILGAIQADPKTVCLPVIVCSVLPDRELALSLGAADFLAKPVTRSMLLAALDRLFQPDDEPSRQVKPRPKVSAGS
jgi:CheY-like chemotaxis protein